MYCTALHWKKIRYIHTKQTKSATKKKKGNRHLLFYNKDVTTSVVGEKKKRKNLFTPQPHIPLSH